MFNRTLSLLRRVVAGHTEAVQEERRARVRYASSRSLTFRPLNVALPGPFSGRVRNVSRGGINLVAGQRFEPGVLLSIDLPAEEGAAGNTVLACIVHTRPLGGGEWSLGCTFAQELSDADLEAFGARRQRPPAPDDQRGWVRFPCDIKASCQTVGSETQPAWSARVLNISPSGLGLLVGQPVENGALLSVDLQGAAGGSAPTMLACVVHVSPRPDKEWALGCNFIRELTEQELAALV